MTFVVGIGILEGTERMETRSAIQIPMVKSI